MYLVYRPYRSLYMSYTIPISSCRSPIPSLSVPADVLYRPYQFLHMPHAVPIGRAADHVPPDINSYTRLMRALSVPMSVPYRPDRPSTCPTPSMSVPMYFSYRMLSFLYICAYRSIPRPRDPCAVRMRVYCVIQVSGNRVCGRDPRPSADAPGGIIRGLRFRMIPLAPHQPPGPPY